MTAPDNDKSEPIRLFWLILLLITVLAGGMRLYKLGDYSFWEDELYTVRSVGTFGEGQLSKQFGHLPSVIGMKANGIDTSQIERDNVAQWQSLGVTQWRVRIGPCIVGILTIPLLGFVSRRLLGDRATLIAVLILAVSPWHLFWSQAGRFYAIQFLCYNLALIWYLRASLERSTRIAALSSVALVLAYMAQPPAILICLVLVADVAFCLIRREPIGLTKTGWALGISAGLLCVGVQLYDMFSNADAYQYHSSLEGHSWKIIAASMVLRNHPVLLAVAGLSLLGLVRKKTRLVSYLAAAGILPVAALMGLALVSQLLGKDSYVHERYTFIVHFAWVTLAAVGLSAVWESAQAHKGKLIAAAAVAAVAVSLLWTDLGYYPDGYRRRWQEAFAYVKPLRQPGEDVACYSSMRTPIARYYLQTDDVLDFAAFPTSPRKLAELKRPTWLVVPAVSATRGEMFEHLNTDTDLKCYYDLRVLQPFASIRVYYYTPPKPPHPAD